MISVFFRRGCGSRERSDLKKYKFSLGWARHNILHLGPSLLRYATVNNNQESIWHLVWVCVCVDTTSEMGFFVVKGLFNEIPYLVKVNVRVIYVITVPS